MHAYRQVPEPLATQFFQTFMSMVGDVTLPEWYLGGPTEPQPISREERIQGLAALWAEARVSFAYWDRVAGLDWDASFREYLPLVEAAEEPAEYYRLLKAFVVQLNEGHTYVVPPPWLRTELVSPPVGVRCIGGAIVVLRGELPAGTVITHVDGRPAGEGLAEVAVTLNASTEPSRLSMAAAYLLAGARDSTVALGVRKPDGTEERVTFKRTGLPPRPVFERVNLGGGRILVRINSWATPAAAEEFHAAFPDFDGVNALIFDLRYNGGGNSQYGEKILRRLVAEPVPPYSISETPLYWGAMTFAGFSRLMLASPEPPTEPDTTRPRFDGPVAVLTSPSTGSASEDFCMLFRTARRGLIVGEPTSGSTGNPAIFQLPGGGIAGISATRVTWRDGSPLIGVGVLPDIPCVPTPAGLGAGRDEVLEVALAALG